MRPMRQDWYSRSSFSPWLVQQKSIWRLSRGLMRHWIRARSRFSRDRMTRDIWAGRMPSSFWISPTIIVPFDWSSDNVRNSTSLSSPPRRRPRSVDRQICVTSWNSSCATSSSRCPLPAAIGVVVPSLVPRNLDGAGGDRGGKERDRSAASLTYSMINVDTTLSIAKGQRLRKRNGLRPNGWDMPAVQARLLSICRPLAPREAYKARGLASDLLRRGTDLLARGGGRPRTRSGQRRARQDHLRRSRVRTAR